MKILLVFFILILSNQIFADDCKIFISEATSDTGFSEDCEVVKINDELLEVKLNIDSIMDSTIGELKAGEHCEVLSEKETYRPDSFNCGFNDYGLPNQAFYTVLNLRCQELGDPPDYQVYRTWMAESKIFKECILF